MQDKKVYICLTCWCIWSRWLSLSKTGSSQWANKGLIRCRNCYVSSALRIVFSLLYLYIQWVLELHGFKLHGFEQHWVSEKSKKYCTTRNPWATQIIMNQFVLISTRNTWAARNTELYNMFFKYKIHFGMKNALEI